MERIVVTADGVPLHVLDAEGRGQPIVLLHGGGRSVADWTDVAARLSALGYRPVAIDLRGHGATPVAAWSWDAALADVASVVAALELARPAVVGHSLGGMVAALWAARHPECPLAVNADGHGNPTSPEQFASPGPEGGADALLLLLREMATGLDPLLREVMAAIDALDLLDVYVHAQCPLLIIRGRESMAEVLPDDVQGAWRAYERWTEDRLRQTADQYPNVEVVLTPTAHDVHLEAPELLASLIDQRLPG